MSNALRPASTVLLLREGPDGPEVWLMERNRSTAFMASAWVFPGGRVDDADEFTEVATLPSDDLLGLVPRAFWTAAARELEEEAAVRLGTGAYALNELRLWSHWVTPEVESRRYDTWFFVARLPAGTEPKIDGNEAVAGGWFTAAAAIRGYEAGSLPVAPPTLRTLHELARYRTVDDAWSAERRCPVICPTFFKQEDGTLFVLLPGDPGHPSTDAVDPPFRYAFDIGRWWARTPPT